MTLYLNRKEREEFKEGLYCRYLNYLKLSDFKISKTYTYYLPRKGPSTNTLTTISTINGVLTLNAPRCSSCLTQIYSVNLSRLHLRHLKS